MGGPLGEKAGRLQTNDMAELRQPAESVDQSISRYTLAALISYFICAKRSALSKLTGYDTAHASLAGVHKREAPDGNMDHLATKLEQAHTETRRRSASQRARGGI